jgi:bifunctional non-homologous end joining protein LigD
LKSWAVPKGPSLNPADKRLAMMVEDHPYDYKDFEGVIPKGEYGAGEVIIWDEGTYSAPGTKDRKESEAKLREGLKKGDLKFQLNGTKLKGEFVLVNMKSRGEKEWLLIKHKDEFASTKDITKEDRSVISGRTLEELAGDDVKKKSGPGIS